MTMIAVTGGAGYIGSHVCVRLLEAGHHVLLLDDFSHSRRSVVERIRSVAGRAPSLVVVDVTDKHALRHATRGARVDGVVHLAGVKSVAASLQDPLRYQRINVEGTRNVHEVFRDVPFVYSSSATVYGVPHASPVREDAPKAPATPYGQSKLNAERLLLDGHRGEGGAGLVILRYFNPVGAHPSGLIGEDPVGVGDNLMPRIERVAAGTDERLTIFGRDYPTPDGTAVRDYVHVDDLADAHVRALHATARGTTQVYNLGSSRGSSVLEVVQTFERVTGRRIPTTWGPRREGDVPAIWADVGAARTALGWTAQRSLGDACVDAMRWHRWRTGHAPPAGHTAAMRTA